MDNPYKRLYRSRDQRMIAGVCGGLGEFFGIDPTLVRLLFVLGTLLGFPGALALGYLIMLIVVPEEPAGVSGEAVQPFSTAEPLEKAPPESFEAAGPQANTGSTVYEEPGSPA